MQNLKGDKRGSIFDVAFILVALLGTAIVILIIAYVFPQITAQIGATEIGNLSSSQAALDKTDNITGNLDNIFLTIFAGLSIAVFVTSFKIDSSPALIPIYIILLAMLVTVAAVGEYVYTEFSEVSQFAATAATHQVTNYIMSNLIITSIIIGVLSFILVFAKPGGGNPF